MKVTKRKTKREGTKETPEAKVTKEKTKGKVTKENQE